MSTNSLTDAYPEQPAERDRWILARRGARGRLDPLKPHTFLVEEERAESGEIVPVATVFLSNRECPWRCLMCDLWKNTLTRTVPLGAIPEQIDFALAELAKQYSAEVQPSCSRDVPAAGINRDQRRSRNWQAAMQTRKMSLKKAPPSPRPSPPGEGETSAAGSPVSSPGVRLPSLMPAPRQIKLYNSGSFFDPRAIPLEDYQGIAERVRGFKRVIVECHPALVGESALRFRDLLESARLGEGKPPFVVNASMGSGTALTPLSIALTPDSSPIGWAKGAPRKERSAAPAQPLSPSLVEPSPAKTDPYGHGSKLELAMGLETAHPEVLEKLNKRMTLEQFRRAAEFLGRNGIALRVFVLVEPPFLDELEALHWAERSVDFAFDCGATVVSLIPTRSGNGALDALAARGDFSPPKLSTLEAALDYGIGLKRGRVFADLWDLERFSDCSACFEARRARLYRMNLGQTHRPVVGCEVCQERRAGPTQRVPGQ